MWPSASKFWLWTFCLLSTLRLGYLILFHGFNYHAYIFTLKFWPRLQSYFPNFLSESYTGSIVGISGEHVRHRTLDPLLPNLMFCSFSCKLLETPFILCVHNHGVELDFILTSYIKASSLKKKKWVVYSWIWPLYIISMAQTPVQAPVFSHVIALAFQPISLFCPCLLQFTISIADRGILLNQK